MEEDEARGKKKKMGRKSVDISRKSRWRRRRRRALRKIGEVGWYLRKMKKQIEWKGREAVREMRKGEGMF